MLVLSRKLGEKVFIGHDIRITVVDIDCGKVRLGVEESRHVPVYREELLLPDGTLPPSRADRPPVLNDPDFRAPDLGGES